MPSRAHFFVAAVVLAGASCSSSPNNPPKDASAGHDGGDAGRDAADAPPAAHDGGDAAPEVARDGGDAAPVDGADAVAAPPPLALTATVVATIGLPGIPVSAAYNAGTKKVYFACQTPAGASAGVAVVDDVMNKVVATITPAAVVTSLAANSATKTVYAAEGAALEIIDSATDTSKKTVPIPDGSVIAGLAVDELHDQTYVVTTVQGGTELFVWDGPMQMLGSLRPPLLTPRGLPPVAVDGTSQLTFVLGVDSNMEGEVVMLDAPSGAPLRLATTKSKVDPGISGVVPIGGGSVAVLYVAPGVVQGVGRMDVALPASFSPAGIAAVDFGQGAIAVVAGFRAGGGLEGVGVDTTAGWVSPFAVPLAAALPAGTVAARLVTAAPVAGGSEVYVDATPDPKSSAAYAPTQTIKLTVTGTSASDAGAATD
jgi:hypothetical protein